MRNLEGAQCDEGSGFTMGRRRRKAAAAEAPAAPPLPDLPPLPALEVPPPAPLPDLAPLPELPPAAPLPDLLRPQKHLSPFPPMLMPTRKCGPSERKTASAGVRPHRSSHEQRSRFAARPIRRSFGHELDREIIVLRKQMHDDRLAEVRMRPRLNSLMQNLWNPINPWTA